MSNLQHIEIRMAFERDTAEILEIYRPYITDSYVSFETEIPSVEELKSRIKNIQKTLPWLVCVVDNQIAGYAYATDHRSRKAYSWTKELSVYLLDQYKNKGIATALYTCLIQLLKIQGVTNCLAGIALPNESSIRFHEKFGFKKVGIYHQVGYKLNAFRDVGWWELFIAEKNDPPSGIIPIGKIEKTKDFERAVITGLNRIL